MKEETPRSVFLGVFLAFSVALSASASLVTVSSTETWDGISNPHSADGVALSGAGTDANPYTYTIPNGMTITSTGRINLHSAGDYSIKFVIQGGDLQMDAGAVLNVERFGIRTIPNKRFVLDLSGTNSITGAGQIGPITSASSTPMAISGERKRREPSRWERKVTPSSEMATSPGPGRGTAPPAWERSARSPREKTWKPPESVRMGPSQRMKAWSPPSRRTSSCPGRR